MQNPIVHSRPWIQERDIAAVSAQLRTGMIGQGARTAELESRAARWFSAADAVAVASGSAAVALGLRALGLGQDDEVLLPTYLCKSVLHAVWSVGAKPKFVDAGPCWLSEPAQFRAAAGQRTRAIIAAHLYGCWLDAQGWDAFGLPLIEDLAQALPAEAARRLMGDIGVLSLHPTKCIAAGEGGVAVARSAQLGRKMRSLRDGPASAAHARQFAPLSDMAAALAGSQLDRYPDFLSRRRRIAALYLDGLRPICPDWLPSHELLERSMFFRFVLRVPGGLPAVESAFRADGIIVRKGVDELLHRVAGEDDQSYPAAVRYFDTTVSLPIYPALTDAESEHVLACAKKIFATIKDGKPAHRHGATAR